ncbi:MAG: RNA polymerase sigma factor [Candidatus Methylacidiphilales bacterium]|nr:RNA polymerase sigma factor [Candidatus Methylacidiphilales bacterium]
MSVEHTATRSEEDPWIDAAIRGSEEGWRELHRLHYKGLWSAVNQVLRDDALSDDVVQEAFVKAYQQIRKFRRDAKFSTWIYRIALNQAYDTLRKTQRRSKWLGLFPLQTGEEGETLEHEAIDEHDAAKEAALGDDRAALARALDSLGPDHRAVVELRLIQGFSTEETARILRCKKGTVLSRLFYSCQKLKKILEETYKER